jgi:hypothetical protein
MAEYNYTLIVSQYRWSRHQFIVKPKQDFLEKAKAFAIELMTYKRGEDEAPWRKPVEESLGDLTYHKEDMIYPRYNINDAGDIYFINSKHCNSLKNEAIEYAEKSRQDAKGYKPKGMAEDIQERHNFMKVKEILEKYFEIA